MAEQRSTLRLKSSELVPADEDRRVELATYDVLLPCRKYEVEYKVAVLGHVSPTLEFLLRLLKAVGGLSEEDVRAFFGYTLVEMEFVLGEAASPGYVERKDGRLWLTTAGEALFTGGDGEPAVFSVESRRSNFGFDQLSISPQQPVWLDEVEMDLPDLALDAPAGLGTASNTVRGRFHHFFRELGDRRDREQVQRKDLYSIDSVVAGDRYQVPVRLQVFSQASSPSLGEIDLTAWRPDQEMADRPQVEQAAGRFLAELKLNKRADQDKEAYRWLLELAPDFFKEFTVAAGLSVERYWREAVSRAGEPRSDRKTVALVGSLFNQGNIERLLRVVEYGLRTSAPPSTIFSVPPQVKHWGATTLLRDLNSLVKVKLRGTDVSAETEPDTCCIFTGRPPRYVRKCFDEVESVDNCGLAGAVELYSIPGVAAVVLIHAPIGLLHQGVPAPLGIATFDPEILGKVELAIADQVLRYVGDFNRRGALEARLARAVTVEESGAPG